MAFDVYPIAHIAPLSVGAGGTSAFIPFTEQADPLAVVDMVIRLVMLGDGCNPPPGGAPDPTIFLKAGTGDEVEVPLSPLVSSVYSTPGTTSHVADVRVLEEANNVYKIEAFISTPGSAWQIKIRNNDAVAREFTWVVASSDAESLQPWMDVTSTAITLDALTNQTINQALEISNKGTGDLVVSNVVGALGSGFSIASVPGAIPPNDCDTLGLTFLGAALPGATAALMLDVTGNDTTSQIGGTHNRRVTLSATTRKFEVALMLDGSGSMAWRPDGTQDVPLIESRWSKLTMSAKQFLDMLGFFAGGMGRFAVGVFPDIVPPTVPSPSSADIQAAADITVMAINNAKNALDPLIPSGGTSMGHGIQRSIGATPVTFGYYEGAVNSVTFNRRFLVLMSDGWHNSPPPPASPNPPDFYQAFRDKRVKALTIGYGDPAAPAGSEVDHVLLNTIANESEGEFFSSGADNAGLDLPESFRDAITEGLSLNPIVDPPVTLTAASRDFRREVTILPYDTKVSFIVNWVTDNLPVTVTLITPLCEVITAASMPVNSVFNTHPRYRIFSFESSFLQNTANPASPRFGSWTLIVSAPGLAHSEKFDYEVLTESRLRLALSFDRTRFYAGDTFRLDATLTLDGLPVRDATVTVTRTKPGKSAQKFLAGTLVTPTELAKVRQKFLGRDVNLNGLRALALASKGITFARFDATETIPMADAQNNGIYTAAIAGTATIGSHDFHVTALGQTPEGVSFRREQRAHVLVEAQPDPVFTLVDTQYFQIDDFITAVVRVYPRDRFGNALVIDPAVDPRFQFIVEGAEPIKGIETVGDGSYTRTIRYKSTAKPVVQVRTGKVDITPKTRLTSVTDLQYVDQVVTFKKGREAKSGANKHTDARHILGGVTTKKDQFLALGERGEVVVGVKGQIIRAAGKDDVTVFVSPAPDLRPYRVEALAPAGRNKWVSLGASPGVSSTFSLAKAGLKTTRAIRITDAGGRALNTDMSVDDAPGVNLLGVGVKSVGKAPN